MFKNQIIKPVLPLLILAGAIVCITTPVQATSCTPDFCDDPAIGTVANPLCDNPSPEHCSIVTNPSQERYQPVPAYGCRDCSGSCVRTPRALWVYHVTCDYAGNKIFCFSTDKYVRYTTASSGTCSTRPKGDTNALGGWSTLKP